MTPYQRRSNPWLQRMVEDMQVRNFAANTIDSYSWHADKFCTHFGKPPQELGPEEVRLYQLYLVNEKKASWSSFNQAVCALRFLYEISLAKPWAITHIPFGKRPKTLPLVLSDQQANLLIQCTDNLKHKMVLLTCYAAGLRLAEATHLRVADIDGQRNQIRVRCGKGGKERRVPASPRLLSELREYWKIHRPSNFLFPGKTPDVPLSSATVQKACRLSAALAKINIPATPHTMRHSYATGMLEAGVDLLTISKLLGHSSFVTTMIYLHVRQQHFDRAPSPIDWLPVRQCPKWAQPANPEPVAPEVVSNATPEVAPVPSPPPAQRRRSGRARSKPRQASQRRRPRHG